MPNLPREFHKPTQPDEAAQLIRRTGGWPLMPSPRLPDDYLAGAPAAIDLTGLNLDYVRRAPDGRLQIGAMTPLQTLVEAPLAQDVAGGLLVRAAQLAAGSAMRHLATVGGALTAPKGPPEVALALLVLDASLLLQGASARREAPLSEFAPGADLLLEVSLTAARRGALERVARTPRDEAIVAVAAVMQIEHGVCRHVRLAVGGAGPRPALVRSVEKVLLNEKVTDARLDEAAEAVEAVVNPSDDFRASADYRRAMARVLARRALSGLSS